MRQHGDEGIHTKEFDLATHEVADPRLGYAETLSGAFLGQMLFMNALLELDHKHRPQLQVGRLFSAKSQVPKDIARRYVILHVFPL